MYDVTFVIGSVAFFILMLMYVRACDRLGQDQAQNEEQKS